MAAANKTVWGIHTMDDPLFLNQNLIAIGWEEMGDLSVICKGWQQEPPAGTGYSQNRDYLPYNR